MNDGRQKRSYCYCLDCASAIIKVLLSGKVMHAYNISDPNSVITIREMAELFIEAGGVRIRTEAVSDAEKRAFNPMQHSSLDSAKLQQLVWKSSFSAKEGLYHTVQIIRNRVF